MRRTELFFAILLSLSWTSLARATLRVTPVNSNGDPLVNSAGGYFYYPSATFSDTATLFLDASDVTVPTLVDLTKNVDNFATTQSGLLLFNVTSDAVITTPTTGRTVLAVYTSSGTTTGLVPIASVQIPPVVTGASGVECSQSTSCQGSLGVVAPSGTITYRGAVQYTPKSTVQIGLYPRDICNGFLARYTGALPVGCANASTVNVVGGVSGTTMRLTFAIVTADATSGLPPETQPGTESAVANIAFVDSGSTITGCPSTTGIYFPGDSQIFLNANTFSATTPAAAAPLITMVVVGNDGAGSAIQSSNYSAQNSIVGRFGLGSTDQVLGGLINTNSTSDHPYQLAFMARDAAGLVATSTCTLDGVRSADIRGFLTKSRCFIATAAFRSGEAEPVRMLREFRDSVLLQSAPGEMFVQWYYRWSPEAAEWLMNHPLFRFPILLALIPLEVIAWLFLHPAWMALIALVNGFVFLIGFRGTLDEA